MKKIRIPLLIISILIPLFLGGVAGVLNVEGMRGFGMLVRPKLTPAPWVFIVVWTVLYILMGIACYFVLSEDCLWQAKAKALKVYVLQLFFNFLWPFIFFGQDAFVFALYWLFALLGITILNVVLFFGVKRVSGWLMLPYVLWLLAAIYLNWRIIVLNL